MVRSPTNQYHVRPLESLADYRAAVRLQKDTWGSEFSELVPLTILKVSRILGGVASGAFSPDGVLAGFVFGMTGVRGGQLVHWSDMLAVRPEARDEGLGTLLKHHQRDAVMALGVRAMHWTFDPLQARNAHLNVTRLGAVLRDYEVNIYGDSDSPLHRGIGTDRFIVTWELGSPQVVERIEDPQRTPAPLPTATVLLGASLDDLGRAAPVWEGADVLGGRLKASTAFDTHEPVSVAIPSRIGVVMERAPKLALSWRRATRRAIQACLEAGYEVTGFLRGDETSKYLFTPRAQPTLSHPVPTPREQQTQEPRSVFHPERDTSG